MIEELLAAFDALGECGVELVYSHPMGWRLSEKEGPAFECSLFDLNTFLDLLKKIQTEKGLWPVELK
tara:strand:+ start:329 stop:529 length:201 start_codon:yes stop_codon:yes gene_type:complete